MVANHVLNIFPLKLIRPYLQELVLPNLEKIFPNYSANPTMYSSIVGVMLHKTKGCSYEPLQNLAIFCLSISNALC